MHFNQYISQFEQDNKLIPVFFKLVSTYSKMSLHNLEAALKSEKTDSLEKLAHLQVLVLALTLWPWENYITFLGLSFLTYKTQELDQLIFKHPISFKILLLHKSLILTYSRWTLKSTRNDNAVLSHKVDNLHHMQFILKCMTKSNLCALHLRS